MTSEKAAENVPDYGDLGKSARDVFRAGYAFDLAKIKIRSPPHDFGVEIDSFATLRDFHAAGSILTRYTNPNYGKFSLKFESKRAIVGEYNTNGILSENLDLVAGYSVQMADSYQSGSCAIKFHNQLSNVTCCLTKDSDRGADLLGSFVVRIRNCLLGYQASFDTDVSKLTKSNFACAMDLDQVMLHLRVMQLPREIAFSALCKVNEQLDVALDTKVASNQPPEIPLTLWFAGVGVAYKLDEQCKLRVKLDKNLQLGTSMQINLQPNILLTLAFSLDMMNPSAGRHKVGFGLDIQG